MGNFLFHHLATLHTNNLSLSLSLEAAFLSLTEATWRLAKRQFDVKPNRKRTNKLIQLQPNDRTNARKKGTKTIANEKEFISE